MPRSVAALCASTPAPRQHLRTKIGPHEGNNLAALVD